MGLFDRVRTFFSPPLAVPEDLAASVNATLPAPPRELAPSDFVIKREMYPLIPYAGWEPGAIMQAVNDFDVGNFGSAELLYHAMTKEPRIGAGLAQRAASIRQFPWDFCLPPDAPEEIKILAQLLKTDWQSVLNDKDRGEIIERFVMFGFVVCRVQWGFANGQRQPKIIPWSHSYIQWRPDWRAFQVATLDRNEPLKRIVNDGREWVIFDLGGERPWLKGALRKLAFGYFNCLVAQDRWLHLNDAFGEPTKCVTVPRLMRESPEVKRMAGVVQALRAGDYLILPKDKDGYGYDYKLEQASAQGFETFRAQLLDLWYANIAIVLLGHNLSQFNKGAAMAAQKSSVDDVTRTLSEADAKILSCGMALVAKVWVRANFGWNDFPDLPRPLESYTWALEFDTKPPEDIKASAAAAQSYAGGMASYAKVLTVDDLPIDRIASAERAGFIMLPKDKWPEHLGEAPPSGPATKPLPAKVAPQLPAAAKEGAKPEKADAKEAKLSDDGKGPRAMVCLYPPPELAQKLAFPGGERAEQLHVTLGYLGRVVDMPPGALEAVRKQVVAIAAQSAQLTGFVGGMGRFAASGTSEGKDVVYASLDVPGLVELRQKLAAACAAAGAPFRREHGFTPHMTLAYLDPGQAIGMERASAQPVDFGAIFMVVDDEPEEYPLTGAHLEVLADTAEPDEADAEEDELSLLNDLPLDPGKHWDASAARRRIFRYASKDGSGGKASMSWAKARRAFLYVTGDGTRFGDYHMPIADVRGGHLVVVWGAVVAAAGALRGSHGEQPHGTSDELRRARGRVGAYYRRFGHSPPWEETQAG